MGACADALRELRGIADRLTTGTGRGLEHEQANVVRLVQNSPCEALKALAPHVQHDQPERVLLAWQALVVNGLEPTEPALPKVAEIRARSSGSIVQVISTSEPPRSAPVPVPMNVWIDHARQVVAVLIARVAAAEAAEAAAKAPAPGGGVDGPPALRAGAEAIDEHDAALLAFLNRNPNLRRKVSDVLPEKGPQDRKAVAKRLRKLADRTPPLVDYPKDGRSGVVILPAGAEALKRATAPTPR